MVGSARAYARGRLALYAKSGQTDLAKARTIAIANPAHAPYGVAARQMLRARPDWAAISGKIVYAENVRQALQFAESGSADVALVTSDSVRRGREVSRSLCQRTALCACAPRLNGRRELYVPPGYGPHTFGDLDSRRRLEGGQRVLNRSGRDGFGALEWPNPIEPPNG